MESIKTIMDDELKHLNFNLRLAKAVKRYEDEFVNKNDDHVNFFSNPLCGVWPARFHRDDMYEWFDNIVQADDNAISRRVKGLDDVEETWVRATDPMNITCLYMMYRFLKSDMPQRARKDAAVSCLKILHFKYVTSLMAHYFPHQADQSTAWAAYNSLSNKFSLKVHGSWLKLFQARAEDIISNSSIHKRTVETFEKTADVVYMISDTQIRVRDIVKNQYAKFEEVRSSDSAIVRTNNLVSIDGDVVVRDMKRNWTPYMSYIKKISQDPTRFIKDELITVVCDAMHTMPPAPFKECLEYISEVSGTPKGRDVDELLKETILHAIEFISKNRDVQSNVKSTIGLIQRLRLNYISSRARDPGLMKMRKIGEKVVKSKFKTRNPAHISAVRTGLFLYIVIRVFAMDHYK